MIQLSLQQKHPTVMLQREIICSLLLLIVLITLQSQKLQLYIHLYSQVSTKLRQPSKKLSQVWPKTV